MLPYSALLHWLGASEMLRLMYQFPTWMQALYPGVVWRKEQEKKVVYLTFDYIEVFEVHAFGLHLIQRRCQFRIDHAASKRLSTNQYQITSLKNTGVFVLAGRRAGMKILVHLLDGLIARICNERIEIDIKNVGAGIDRGLRGCRIWSAGVIRECAGGVCGCGGSCDGRQGWQIKRRHRYIQVQGSLWFIAGYQPDHIQAETGK